MKKIQTQELPIVITIAALLISNVSDIIEEWTSIPSMFVQFFALVLMLIPTYIWISGWLKHRKNKGEENKMKYLMKPFFYLFGSVLLFNCGKDDCLKIRNKYTGNGQYFFELNDSGVFNNSGNSTDEDPNPTAIVSQDTYNKYQVGDKFCRE